MASSNECMKTVPKISRTGLDKKTQYKISKSKVLVVGAGGIGCELLKNLVLTGFKNIEIIDLDTIDVSNLNRQFLFQKKHVKMSKAKVARETALTFNPKASVKAYHDSIISSDYNVHFFKQFNMVLNALDNRAARNHVNRLCLAAEIPLVESGTAGYNGQVELISKGLTKCYECDPKPPQKSFPGCTIRNTPSEPIHCIVWAKHLFNQLFGAFDPDEDVSPDTADPEAAGDAGNKAMNSEAKDDGNVMRMSTRLWAQSCNYDSEKLFKKLFHDDIKYLLSMSNLWKNRRPPTPLEWDNLPSDSEKEATQSGIKDQRQWSLRECVKIFGDSCKGLQKQLEALKADDHLVWDKDDNHAMDFVTACANIRAYIFGIPLNTKFDIKSMAGNIIPAIATTNAMIAGIMVIHAINILKSKAEKCQTTYVRFKPNNRGQIVVPEKTLIKPNPNCYVCADKPKVVLYVNINEMLVKDLEDAVLKKTLNMVAPDVCIDDNSGTIVISSEEGETEEYSNKTLSEAKIFDGVFLSADDFLQDFKLNIFVVHKEKFENGVQFEISQEVEAVPKKLEEATNGAEKETPQAQEDNDDDLQLVESDDDIEMKEVEEKATDLSLISKKRKLENEGVPVKKRRTINDSVELE